MVTYYVLFLMGHILGINLKDDGIHGQFDFSYRQCVSELAMMEITMDDFCSTSGFTGMHGNLMRYFASYSWVTLLYYINTMVCDG